MDIENMSKTDLIITAFFLCFVTAVVTGIVIVFLFEDAPEDIIRVSERIVSQEATTSSDVTTGTELNPEDASTEDSSDSNSDQSQYEILEASVDAVARVTASGITPQAGVLLELSDRNAVVTSEADYSSDIQALFEDGTVVDLTSSDIGNQSFSVLLTADSSNDINPLSVRNQLPTIDESVFVIPLSQQPQIMQATITEVSDNSINTSIGSLPAVSLLLNNNGEVIGLYNATEEKFEPIKWITG